MSRTLFSPPIHAQLTFCTLWFFVLGAVYLSTSSMLGKRSIRENILPMSQCPTSFWDEYCWIFRKKIVCWTLIGVARKAPAMEGLLPDRGGNDRKREQIELSRTKVYHWQKRRRHAILDRSFNYSSNSKIKVDPTNTDYYLSSFARENVARRNFAS